MSGSGVRARQAVGADDGQMFVEMAVVAPVMIVMAIVVVNLMLYIEAASRFDRVVPDAIMAVAVSPGSGASEGSAQEHAVTVAIAGAMEGIANVDVQVRAVSAWSWGDGDGVGFSFAPHLTRYVCTMTYHPWPSALTVAGVEAGIPLTLTHERTFTVDRYRSGVVF